MNKVRVIPVWDMTEKEWLKAREGGTGGSDAGTIARVNKYKSVYELWAEKTGIIEREFTGNDATDWGHKLENPIAEFYAEKHNAAVVEWPVILWSLEEGREFMFANLDFVIVEPSKQFPAGVVTQWRSIEEPEGVKGILEVKTAAISSPGNPGSWLNNKIPESYMLQGYHYGIVTGWKSITFSALVGGYGLQVREMEWDQEIADNLVIAEKIFWEQVQTLTPPEVDGSDATESAQQRRYPKHTSGKVYEGGDRLQRLWEDFEQAKIEADEADKKRKMLRAQIVELLGDSEYATVNGVTIASYRASRETETFDTRAFQERHPELYSQFLKTKNGVRQLRGSK